jgi:hypothetical protein
MSVFGATPFPWYRIAIIVLLAFALLWILFRPPRENP